MSSAILYLAIVAIWACVLIPRWLGATRPAGPPRARRLPTVRREPRRDADSPTRRERAPRRRGRGRGAAAGLAPAGREPLSAEESRRRMLAARRRLLLMLIGLEPRRSRSRSSGWPPCGWSSRPRSCSSVTCCCSARPGRPTRSGPSTRPRRSRAAMERDRARDAQARRATPAEGTSTAGVAGGRGGARGEVRRRPGRRRLRGLRPRP